MAAPKSQKDEFFLTCSRCGGQSVLARDLKGVNLIRCSECAGVGLYARIGGDWLYWDLKVNSFLIRFNKIKRGIRMTLDGLLIIFGIAGFLAGFWELFKIIEEGLPLNNFLIGFSFSRMIFWISSLTDLYTFYRMDQETRRKYQLKRKPPLSESEITPPKISFEEVSRLDPKSKIEISKFFTNEASKVIEESWQAALKFKNEKVSPIHLLIALIPSPKFRIIATRLGLKSKPLFERVKKALAQEARLFQKEPYFSLDFKKILFLAYNEAYQLRRDQVDIMGLFVALTSLEGRVQDILYDLEIDSDKAKNVGAWIYIQEVLRRQWAALRAKASLKPKGIMNRAMTARTTPLLDQLSRDLTQAARAGALHPLIDREKELEECLRVLERRLGNVILVGEAGAGKSIIVDGIAQRMAAEEIPEVLQDKRLASLSTGSLVAGAAIRGELERRMIRIIDEVMVAGNVILFIDDIANLIGAGTAGPEGALDVSDILATALTQGQLKVIGTATRADYARYLENNDVFMRRFQVVRVEEMDHNGAIQVLEAKTGPIEYRQRVLISYDAIEKAVKLSDRFIHERYLPAKAISILEEAAVYVRRSRGKGATVRGEDIAKVISEKTKIEVTEITAKESEKLLNLEKEIHQRIVNQEEAVESVANALRRARAELRDIKKPIVNLLFLGPTGVGKTELAKTVAKVYFGSAQNMIRLDMSEYQNPDSLSRLIGAPPGYGRTSGLLTENVRNNPFSLVLLDELEKAHPDILNVFLQVMDDGRLTDSSGRTIDFTNVILIATSNAGTDLIQEGLRGGVAISDIKNLLLEKVLKRYFHPEFLNRFDGITVFKPLSIAEVEQITIILLKELAVQLEKKGITLKASSEAIKELAKEGFDPTLGARPLKRVIQEKVDNALVKYLLTGQLGRRDVAVLEPGGVIRVEKAEELK